MLALHDRQSSGGQVNPLAGWERGIQKIVRVGEVGLDLGEQG